MLDCGSLDGEARRLRQGLYEVSAGQHHGRIVRALGTTLRASGLPARIGQRCLICNRHDGSRLLADVIGVDRGDAVLLPLGRTDGIALDSDVTLLTQSASVACGDALLGRVLDGFGLPLDGHGLPANMPWRAVYAAAPHPLERQRVNQPLTTGLRVIDTLLTVGVGQRFGIFAPAGTGKSSLLGMLADRSPVERIVIALVGERGREVREFIDDCLGAGAMARSVVVVATSDRPAAERLAAAYTATAIAEGFRATGHRVLLLLDSVTRFARAVRDVGLSAGEPAVRQGYTPSVFAELPRLFERAGNDAAGSLTAFYSVLTEDASADDPVAEETRSILDGHIILSRQLAEDGRFPAIDVLASVSRLASRLQSPVQRQLACRARELLARYRDVEFLLQLGEYKLGTDKRIDEAIGLEPALSDFIRQPIDEFTPSEASWERLAALLGEAPAHA